MSSDQNIDIDSLLSGNKNAWKEFVRKVAPPAYAIIDKTLRQAGYSQDEAQDILQDLFLKLCRDNFRLLRKYDSKKAKITTWVTLIARNLAIDYLRRRRIPTTPLENVNEPACDNPAPSDDIDLPFDILPPRQMLIMKLLYERELSVKEVAEFMNISKQSVRSARHKAIKKLRKAVLSHNDIKR